MLAYLITFAVSLKNDKSLSRSSTPILEKIYEVEKSDEDEKAFKFSNHLKRHSITRANPLKVKPHLPSLQIPINLNDDIPPESGSVLKRLFKKVEPIIDESVPIFGELIWLLIYRIIYEICQSNLFHPLSYRPLPCHYFKYLFE